MVEICIINLLWWFYELELPRNLSNKHFITPTFLSGIRFYSFMREPKYFALNYFSKGTSALYPDGDKESCYYDVNNDDNDAIY